MVRTPHARSATLVRTIHLLVYRNCVFAGHPKQINQTAAAGVHSNNMKVNHITPVLRSLHMLPVCQRKYYCSWNCLGPKYIPDLVLYHETIQTSHIMGQVLLSIRK